MFSATSCQGVCALNKIYGLVSESHILRGSRVLVVSREGRSRCSAVTMAFLMYHLAYSLEASHTGVVRTHQLHKAMQCTGVRPVKMSEL